MAQANILDLIKKNRSRIGRELADEGLEDFSAASASRFRVTQRCITGHVVGRTLDAGCGYMPFRQYVQLFADKYESLDIERRRSDVDHVGDVQNLEGFPDNTYDTVLCLEVLEHLPRPDRALAEIARILRPGGKAILSVPHLSRLHEIPNDYYRFTEYGLSYLVESSGLNEIELHSHGGLIGFLAHQVSMAVLGLTWSVPIIGRLTYYLNRLAFVHPPLWLDRLVDRHGLFPLGYVAVAQKPTHK